MTATKILLTGASGYVGGTILTSLLAEKAAWASELEISALVRSEIQAKSIRDLGIQPVEVSSYDDVKTWSSVAEGFDVVIHAAAGWNANASVALIQGLGQRKKKTNSEVHFLGVSGTTNISDRPLSTGHVETRVLSDEEDMYSYMKYRQSIEEYMPRAADIAVVESGLELAVNTYIVMAPHIFGIGTGSFNRFTLPVNMKMNGAKSIDQGFVVGDGSAVWSHVHIQDLADLYLIMLRHLVTGQEIPSGKKGIYFAESGVHAQLDMAEKVAKAGKALGMLRSDEVKNVSLEEGGKLFGGWGPMMAEQGGASNARIKGSLSRSLGWSPQRECEWDTTVRRELEEFAKNPPPARDLGKLNVITDN